MTTLLIEEPIIHVIKKVMKELGKLFEKYKDNLIDKETDYLANFSYNTSNFYGLPKVHKSDIITQATEMNMK